MKFGEKMKGDIFEKLIFCKVKVVRPATAVQGKTPLARMKKSFWLYPANESELSANLKAEADILTSLFFDSQKLPKFNKPSSVPLSFISDFFAKYKIDQSIRCTFMVNKNVSEDAYKNAYNQQGNRYFFSCLFDDFEASGHSDIRDGSSYSIEQCQTLLLFESRYPFRCFFNGVIERIFNILRVRRLEMYAVNYNGNEMDDGNLGLALRYDASTIVEVRLMII